jgi:hypothetical protein
MIQFFIQDYRNDFFDGIKNPISFFFFFAMALNSFFLLTELIIEQKPFGKISGNYQERKVVFVLSWILLFLTSIFLFDSAMYYCP